MNALQLSKSSDSTAPTLSLVTVPIPRPQPGQVLVKVYVAYINPSDRFNAKGGFSHTTFPRIPGRDFAGVIVDGPADRIGQEVFGSGGDALGFDTDGTHAEYCLMASEGAVPKPKSISFLQAASLGVPYSTAVLIMRRARVTSADKVLVLGARGAVGTAFVHIAKAMGCKTVLRAYRSSEADIDLTSGLPNVRETTGGIEPDVIVDTIGDLGLMSAAIDQLAVRGRYAWISAPKDKKTPPVIEFNIFQGYRKEIELIGVVGSSHSIEETGKYLQTVTDWLEDGAIRLQEEVAWKVMKLADATDQVYDPPRKGMKAAIQMVDLL